MLRILTRTIAKGISELMIMVETQGLRKRAGPTRPLWICLAGSFRPRQDDKTVNATLFGVRPGLIIGIRFTNTCQSEYCTIIELYVTITYT